LDDLCAMCESTELFIIVLFILHTKYVMHNKNFGVRFQ